MDVLDREAVFAALAAERPEAVIHQLTNLSERDFAANSRLRIDGTRNLVDAAKAVGVPRMIAQSIAWVCVPGDGYSTEKDALDLDAPGSRGNMVRAVQSLEQAVAEMPVGVVLRYGLLYGPGTWYRRDGLTTAQMRRGEIGAAPGISSFVHVADAAQAALLALDWPAGVYNIVDDVSAAGTDWVPLYARLVGAPAPPVTPQAEPWERGVANAKARGMGWKPQYPDWRAGFKQVLAGS